MGQDVRARGEVLAVAVERALRMAGRARRVDDGRRVVRPHARGQPSEGVDRGQGATGGLDVGEPVHAGAPVHEQRAGVDDDHAAHTGSVVEHRQRLVEVLLVLDDHHARAAVLEEIAHLAGRARRVDPVGDGAERLRREVRDRPLRARVAEDRHRAAAADAEPRGQPLRHRRHARRQGRPRRLAIDAELLGPERDAIGTRPRTLDQQAGNGGRAQAAEIHRGLAILRRGTPPAEGRIVGTLMATDGVVQAVKRVGLDAGARVVGVAAAEAFRAGVPEGFRPEDILPGARSVVVAGGDGPTAGAWRCPDHRVMEITGYDLRENVAIHAMCDYIERELGYYAVQAPSLPVHGHEPPMSMMHAAELAGLGSRSLAAHIILNPEYGLLYYAALITTLPLEPSPPLAEPACPHPGCVAMYKRIGTTPCLRVCPACLTGTVKDARIEKSTYDREKCHSRAQTYGIGSFQKALLAIVNEDDAAQRHDMIHSDFFVKSIQSIGFFRDSIAQCFECMRVCPVGRKHRKLQ